MGTPKLLRVLFVRSFQALALSCLLLLPLRAGTRTTAVQTKMNCGTGVELRLSSPASNQGGLLLAELRSEKPLREPKGKWDGKEIWFWNLKAAEGARPFVFRALLGVDLEQPLGKYGFAVTVETPAGESATCTANILVRTGHFAMESLQVAEQFVKPDPEQLKRGQEEQKRLREIFASVTPERLWEGSFRIPLDGWTCRALQARQCMLPSAAASFLRKNCFFRAIPWWWITAWEFTLSTVISPKSP